ncbi:MAG TPA: hypothetical protein VGM30_17200 [Puia sp.]|jgi:hypothetical protein
MIRPSVSLLISLLAGTLVVSAQDLTDNNGGPSHTTLSSAIPVTTDSVVKTPAGRSSKKVAHKPLPLAPGWHKEEDQVTGSINRDILTRIKTLNNQLIGFFYDSCLDGPAHHGLWHGEFRSDKADSTGLKYGIKCSFPAAEGQDHNLSLTATLEITANNLAPLTRQVTVYGHDYNAIVPTKIVRNGCAYFEPPYLAGGALMVAIKDGDKNAPHINTWLVTDRIDNLPYTPMSRKEFLEEMGVSLKANKDALIATLKTKNPVRPQADQEADKQKNLESLGTTYNGAELEMRKRNYLDHYKSDEDDLKDLIDAQTAPIDSTIAFIDGMLHRLAPATLAAPAYVLAKAAEFEGFADGEDEAVMLIHRETPVSGMAAASDKPRYFLVSWTYDPADTGAVAIKELLNKNLDVVYIRWLLKK